jgi:hypothetical protein
VGVTEVDLHVCREGGLGVAVHLSGLVPGQGAAKMRGHGGDGGQRRVTYGLLRDLMTSVFPSLERAFDYSSHKGALSGSRSSSRVQRTDITPACLATARLGAPGSATSSWVEETCGTEVSVLLSWNGTVCSVSDEAMRTARHHEGN